MLSLFLLAIAFGMHHALEADHVAAVSSLISGRRRLPDIVGQGVTWGLGHTLTLFIFAGLAFVLGRSIPDHYVNTLEAIVGIMLVGLGLHVIWRIYRDRVHVHVHQHERGVSHLHVHSHAAESQGTGHSLHDHAHSFGWRTLLVGMTHGMAGSAALLVFALSRDYSAAEGLLFILLFGVGSIAGMALVTAAIGVPLLLTDRFLTWANRGLQVCVALVTVAIGSEIVYTRLLAG